MTAVSAPPTRMRPADQVLTGTDMGGSWPTRHSFAPSLIRHAAAHRWAVTRARLELDGAGAGTVVYRVDAQGHTLHFVALSQTIGEAQRTDRVIATAWDVTAALVEGDVTPAREALLRRSLPHQEGGRYDPDTIMVTRANRSARFFDYVAGCLARGRQPRVDRIGPSPYLLRSTAYYGNGKFGTTQFDHLGPGHPLAVPYRSQMLSAWLLRELSIDLVNHVAQATAERPGRATVLSPEWARYFGIGNATGLGMVPFVVNHPEILDAWARMREAPLAAALACRHAPGDPDLATVASLLQRARAHFEQKHQLRTAPFASPDTIVQGLAALATVLDDYRRSLDRVTAHHILARLHDLATAQDAQVRGVLASIITEIAPPAPGQEARLTVTEDPQIDPTAPCGALLALARAGYRWAHEYDFTRPAATAYYWFSAQDSEEPRRSPRRPQPPAGTEHSTDIARRVTALVDDLAGTEPHQTVAAFLVRHPRHRFAVTRVQRTARLQYGELRANLLDQRFLPLQVQRFQLACYGMTNYSPQSTDWLRVTLFSGAPRPAELELGPPDLEACLFPIAPDQDR